MDPESTQPKDGAASQEFGCYLAVCGLVAVGLIVLAVVGDSPAESEPESASEPVASQPVSAPQEPAPGSQRPPDPPAGRPEYRSVDAYLLKMDRFAQGEKELEADLVDDRPAFEHALTQLLLAEDVGAPVRLVFFAVVQGPGFVATDSALWRAADPLLGTEFPTSMRDGVEVVYAGDLYFWWEEEGAQRYESFRQYEQWQRGDFAQNVAIPKYRKVVKGE